MCVPSELTCSSRSIVLQHLSYPPAQTRVWTGL